MNKKYSLRKYILIFLLLLIIIPLFSCGDDSEYVPPVPGENFVAVDGEHTIVDEDVSSYIVIKNKPNKHGLLTSITMHMIFAKGERTNRIYNYYQFDYYNQNEMIGFDFHIFDSIDGQMRNYGQNFMPYYHLKEKIECFNYRIDYSFSMYNKETLKKEYFEKTINIYEKVIDFGSKEDYENNINDYEIEVVDNTNVKEDFYRYQINLTRKEEGVGHIDMQVFVELGDGSIIPYLGLYHYSMEYKTYNSISDETLLKNYKILKFYFKIIEYNNDGSINNYTYKI